MKLKPGYYFDHWKDIAIIYPCGKIEIFTLLHQWVEAFGIAGAEYIGEL